MPPAGRETTAKGNTAPPLADGVELLGEYQGSGFKEPRYLVRRPDGQMVQLTDLLYFVVEALDGARSYDDIAREVGGRYGKTVTPDNVRYLIENSLMKDGLLATPDGRQPEIEKADPLLRLKLRITILPERAVNFVAALLRPLFWPPVIVAVIVALVAVDVWYFGTHGVAQSLRDMIYQPLTMLLIYGLMILSVGWHELGHATACRYSGARPGKIGFGIYVIWPAFYTDVTDIYRVGKAGKIRTDLGGVYFNGIFAVAMAGVYAVTRFEPILVLIMIQHLLMVYQFMPFLRLDGYYVIADATGIPDLFARIKPTLAGLLPWKRSPKQVTELKPGVRFVVTTWVLLAIPLVLYLFAMMVIGAPRVLATGWDSLLTQWDKASAAWSDGSLAEAAMGGVQGAMVLLPATGMSITSSRVAKRIVVGWLTLSRAHPVTGSGLGLAGAGLLAAAAFVLLPNGEYRPIQPDERWTIAESFEALEAVDTGRPSLTEERAEELGGAPTLREQEGGTDGGDDPTGDDDPAPVDDGDTTEETPDETPDDTADEEETTPSPTPEETTEATPTP